MQNQRTVPGVVLLQRLHPDPSVPKTTRHITQTTSRAEPAEEPSSRRRGPAPCLMNSIHGGGALRVYLSLCRDVPRAHFHHTRYN